MALVGEMNQLGVKDVGTTVQVPNNNRAKLMYYLKCISFVLDLSGEDGINRLTNYQQHASLYDKEERALIALCLALDSTQLDDKCIFQVPEDAIEGGNQFLELSSTETNFVASSSVLIGGTERKVTKIMLYKLSWIQYYYLGPFERISEAKRREKQRKEDTAERLRTREEAAERRRSQKRSSPPPSKACTIL